jgi:MFS superfamily sulfate permease-like transporter
LVIVVMGEMSDIRYFFGLWRIDRVEFGLGVAAFAGVLVYDVLGGVMIGVILALMALADHTRRPQTAVVGRKPTGAYVDTDEHADAEEITGMLIWRVYAPFVFLNARNMLIQLRALVQERKDVRVVVLDATATEGVDTSAISAFAAAQDGLAAAGVELWIVNVREAGWKRIVAKFTAAGKPIPRRFDSLADAVARFESVGAAAATRHGGSPGARSR